MSKDHPHGILLKIAYDGQNYSGLAVQDNAHTVAGELENAIRTMDPRASRLRVCSRTDAGVHARGQYVAFDTYLNISMRGWLLGLSGVLAPDVAVISSAKIRPGFEPCKNARWKTYRYTVLQGTIRDPFLEGRCWRIFDRLNHTRMREEAQALVGTHDFRAFRGQADFRTHTIRTLSSAQVTTLVDQPRVLQITIEGNAFMYHMVRIIAGTLVDIGRGKLEPGAVSRAIQSGNRLDLGMTAPAAGLCLERIELTEQGSDEWPYHLDGAPAEFVHESSAAN
jgi:tRNA pseudouridine38-40 synthase